MNKPELKHIAYHEAGHAAVQLIFSHTPRYVTINPEGNKLGSAPHNDGDYFTEEGMRELVISCYAGREAEMRVGGDGSGSWDDDEQAEPYLQYVGTEEEMRKATAKIVTEHWPLIDRIARELLERTELDMDELDCLLNIYRGEESEKDLQDYRDSWVYQRELEAHKTGG